MANTFNFGGNTRLEKVLEVLNVYTKEYISEVRSNIPPPGQIKHDALYGNDTVMITGDDLLVIHVAISQHCMYFGYESHEHGGYHEKYSKMLEKFSIYFDEVIRPIANILGLNTALGGFIEKKINEEKFYYVRTLPNNYTSSNQKFIEKLLSAVDAKDISKLAETITLQN
jgi:hypothetical protein